MNVLGESTVGAIVTNGDPLTNDDNTVVGLDVNYKNSTFGGNRLVTGSAWTQQSFSSGVSSNQTAYGASLQYPNDRINWKMSYREFGDNFNPALGFVNRPGIRDYNGSWRYRWRPPGVINTIDARLAASLITDTSNSVELSVTAFRPLILETVIGDRIELRYAHFHEVVDVPFPIDDVFIPKGSYDYDEGMVFMSSSPNRPVQLKLDFGGGSYRDGENLRAAPSIEWRPSQHWLFSFSYRFDQFWIPGQKLQADGSLGPKKDRNFRTHLTQMNVNIAFTPDITWNTTVQWDNISDTMGLNSRLRWIITEGRDFFIVFNQDYTTEEGDVKVGRTEPLIKFNWTFRF
jgi:hypothetical protein